MPRRRVVVATAALVTSVATILVGRVAFDPLTDSLGSSFAEQLRSGVETVCRQDRPVRLTSQHAQWYQELEVAAMIGECVPDVEVDQGLRFIVGSRCTPSRPSPDAVTVRLESPPVPLTAGWTRIVRTPDASLDERTRRAPS